MEAQFVSVDRSSKGHLADRNFNGSDVPFFECTVSAVVEVPDGIVLSELQERTVGIFSGPVLFARDKSLIRSYWLGCVSLHFIRNKLTDN